MSTLTCPSLIPHVNASSRLRITAPEFHWNPSTSLWPHHLWPLSLRPLSLTLATPSNYRAAPEASSHQSLRQSHQHELRAAVSLPTWLQDDIGVLNSACEVLHGRNSPILRSFLPPVPTPANFNLSFNYRNGLPCLCTGYSLSQLCLSPTYSLSLEATFPGKPL